MAIVSGLVVWQALLAGILVGVIFNFFTTGGYVFRDLTATRFFRFVVAYLFVYMVNLGAVMLLSLWIDSVIWIQTILSIPVALGSYLLMSRFVFKSSR